MDRQRSRQCKPLARAGADELTGTTLLPPPEHSFWRQSPKELATQAHMTLQELEHARLDALEQAKHALEARPPRPL